MGWWDFGKSFRRGMRSRLSRPNSPSRRGSSETATGRRCRPANWCRETSFACGWGILCPPTYGFLSGDPVQVDQSALTGESLPVGVPGGRRALLQRHRQAGGTGWSGLRPQGCAPTWANTARLVASAQTVSHFQRAVLKIGDYLIVIALVLVVVVFMVALFRGDPWLTTLRFVLVLTVASIPVAMPTILSVTMAVGAQRLAKKRCDRQSAGGDRRDGRYRHSLFRQNRHPHPQPAHPGGALWRGRYHSSRSDSHGGAGLAG
jgi:hypothetical protein